MLALLKAVLIFLGRILGVFGVGLGYLGSFLDVVFKAIGQSKIFITLALIGISLGLFAVFENFVNYAFDLLETSVDFDYSIAYGFIGKIVDISPIISLGRWFLSLWLTEKAMLSSVFGARIFYAFTRNFQGAIRL